MKRFIYLLCLMAIPFAGNAQRWSKSLEKSAKKGDVTAQLEVANAYFKGNGVEKDLEKAAKWYYEAILQGEDAAKENFYSFYSKQLEKFAPQGWMEIRRDSTTIYAQKYPVITDSLVNVVNMGLKDAIYLLENQGYKVEFKGRGRVVAQNPAAGSKVAPNTVINLQLSNNETN